MCVIISIYNNQKNKNKQDYLIDNLKNFQLNNNDGIAFFGFDTAKETKTGYLRELKTDNFTELLNKYNVAHFHFRKATQGKVNNENVHFWKYKQWIMAHNGMAGSYYSMADELSDSNLLFREFIKGGCLEKPFLDINKVNKIVSRQSFWGRLLFINTETKQAYYFGDYYVSVIDNDILIISTQSLKKDVLVLYDLMFQIQNNDIVEAKMDGIFRIDPREQSCKKYKLKFNENNYLACSERELMDIPPKNYQPSFNNWRKI